MGKNVGNECAQQISIEGYSNWPATRKEAERFISRSSSEPLCCLDDSLEDDIQLQPVDTIRRHHIHGVSERADEEVSIAEERE